jgi:hypothetical protein
MIKIKDKNILPGEINGIKKKESLKNVEETKSQGTTGRKTFVKPSTFINKYLGRSLLNDILKRNTTKPANSFQIPVSKSNWRFCIFELGK